MAARATSLRSQMTVRVQSQGGPQAAKIARQQAEEADRLRAWANEIRAREGAAEFRECTSTTMRSGFRVRCIRTGAHTLHAGPHGDIWS